MIKNKTVFVLGAGASMPYGFPSGQRLVDKICNFGQTEKKILEEIVTEVSIVTNFITDLKDADTSSIDFFLEHRPEFHKVGKAAIALALLPLESNFQLIDKWRAERAQGYPTEPNFGGHWYQTLTRLLECSFDDFGDNELSVITFNYDRSLEHYLCKTLAKLYGKTEVECANKLNEINIVHIYGQLGELPWQGSNDTNSKKIRFGEKGVDDHEQRIIIEYAMQGIKTMSENIDKKDSDIMLARTLLSGSQKIIFLGFGFHPRNMEILGTDKVAGDKQISGTCKGLSMQQKIDLGKKAFLSLKWDRQTNNPMGLFEMDVYEFLHKTGIK